MPRTEVIQLTEDVFQIDLHDGGHFGKTAAYVFQDGQTYAVVETGTSHSVPYLLDGLRQLKVDAPAIIAIIVTHVHLDHAGGAGLFLTHCPEATVYVHPRGQRHLVDPTRLMSGARAVYGDSFDTLCGEMTPIPSDRVVSCPDGFTLTLGGRRTLTMLDTPGHARHHLSIFDDVSGYVCTGDVLGLLYPQQLTNWEHRYVAPTTSPTEFDPDAVAESARRIIGFKPSALLHSHFGRNYAVRETAERVVRCVMEYAEMASDGVEEAVIASRLERWYERDLQELGITPAEWPSPAILHDVKLNSMGLHYWFAKMREARDKSS